MCFIIFQIPQWWNNIWVHRGHSVLNIIAVRACKHRTQEIQHLSTATLRVFTKNVHLNIYILQLLQKILPRNHAQAREFINRIIEQDEANADFANKMIFNNECPNCPLQQCWWTIRQKNTHVPENAFIYYMYCSITNF